MWSDVDSAPGAEYRSAAPDPGDSVAKKEDSLQFERALSDLEHLVERMEEGDLSLEDALASYERGVALSRTCQKALDNAEQRVRVLTESDGETRLADFEASEDHHE
jgi:exodeoxyribonuclease VII small subunit